MVNLSLEGHDATQALERPIAEGAEITLIVIALFLASATTLPWRIILPVVVISMLHLRPGIAIAVARIVSPKSFWWRWSGTAPSIVEFFFDNEGFRVIGRASDGNASFEKHYPWHATRYWPRRGSLLILGNDGAGNQRYCLNHQSFGDPAELSFLLERLRPSTHLGKKWLILGAAAGLLILMILVGTLGLGDAL